VVDFFAEWCGPCKKIAPLFENMASFYHHVTFVKVDTERLRSTAAAASIQAIPAFRFYKNGECLEFFSGYDPSRLQNTVTQYAGLSPAELKKQADEKSPYKYFPLKVYIEFKDTKALPKISAKILELNEKKVAAGDELALSTSSVAHLNGLFTKLTDTTRWHCQDIEASEFAMISNLLLWPPQDRFPVIDLVALLIHHPSAQSHYTAACRAGREDNIFDILVASLLDENVTEVVGNVLTSWKFIANAFVWSGSRACLYDLFDLVMDVAMLHSKHTSKFVRPAVAAALLNLCVCAREQDDVDKLRQLATLLLQLLGDDQPRVVAHALQGLGTTAFNKDPVKDLIRTANDPFSCIQPASLATDESKEMLRDLQKMIA